MQMRFLIRALAPILALLLGGLPQTGAAQTTGQTSGGSTVPHAATHAAHAPATANAPANAANVSNSAAEAAQDAAPRSVMLPPPAEAPAPKSVMLQSRPQDDPVLGDLPSDENVQQLEGVTVEGKRDAMSQSDQHLKDLVNKLPCTGCDTKTKKLEEHKSFTERAAKFVAKECCIPTRPPEETEANELDRQLTKQIINPTNNHP